MKAKFGSSQGLRSSGGGGSMAGIGSDPSYRPGGARGGDDITAQLGDVSQKALSYFSSVWETTAKTVQEAHIAEQVTSTWGSLASTVKETVGVSTAPPEPPVSFRPREEPPDLGGNGSGQGSAEDSLSSGWSALSSGAAGWWQK